MIVTSTFMCGRNARALVRIAFIIVTAGAVGATFLYDVVAIYRLPVLLCGTAGPGLILFVQMQRRRAEQAAN